MIEERFVFFSNLLFPSLVALLILMMPFAGGIAGDAISSSKISYAACFSDPSVSMENDEIIISLSGSHSSISFDQLHVPVKPVRLLLPQGKVVDEIRVEKTDPVLFSEENVNDVFSLENQKILDRFDDGKECFEFVGCYWNRGYPVVFLNLYPVFYESEHEQLCYYSEMNVHISTQDADYVPIIKNRGTLDKSLYSMIDNKEIISTYFSSSLNNHETDGVYLIITNDSFAHSPLENNLEYFTYHKEQQGISTHIVTVEEILNNPAYSVNGTWGDNNPSNPFYQTAITHNYSLFDDAQARIRNYIRYAYTELGVEYVLLAGDADVSNPNQNIIPSRGLFANESGLPLINQSMRMGEEEDDIPSDVYYACLDGNFNIDLDAHFGESPDRNQFNGVDEADLLSEVSVGRACVDSFEEIANFVSKTLRYESLHDDSYLAKMLFVGEYLGFPGISAYGGNYKDEIKSLVPDAFNLVTLYDRDMSSHWNKQDLINIINQAPPHIINHDGHSYYGYNMRMSNSDVDLLENNKPFLVYSHGCMAGGFDNPLGYDCIAERLTVETSYGSVAAIMNARYGLGSENNLDSPSLFLDESFFKALFEEGIRTVGDANHFSKEDNIWRINENGVRWVYYETNLFGDPHLTVHLPSDESIDLTCEITSPVPDEGGLYLFGMKLLPLPLRSTPLLIGSFDVTVDATSQPEGEVYGVEFFIDDESYYFDDEYPYIWKVEEPLNGEYKLSVTVYSYNGEQKSTSCSFTGFVKGK